jgi:hypothetical protein
MSDGTVAGMMSGRELMAEMERKRKVCWPATNSGILIPDRVLGPCQGCGLILLSGRQGALCQLRCSYDRAEC